MQTALITGASQGIGKAICEIFLKEGYSVIGIDLVENKSLPYDIIQFDISRLCKPDPLNEQFYNKIVEMTAGRLDVLVNNAAIQIMKPVNQITMDDWQITFNTNVFAPFMLIQRLLPMLRLTKGSVINIASIHALLTKAEFTLYSTSKGALLTMTRALALELAPDVRVNAVLPGATDTPMLRDGFKNNLKGLEVLGNYQPLKRIALPQEIAEIVLFLASPKASFITGAGINVDGGIGVCLHDPNTL